MRASAVQTLNVWVEQTGLAVFVEAELLVDSMKLENPNLRMEVTYLFIVLYAFYYGFLST